VLRKVLFNGPGGNFVIHHKEGTSKALGTQGRFRRFGDREEHLHAGAMAHFAVYLDGASMDPKDPQQGREAQASPGGFGREEWIKNIPDGFPGYAVAGVRDIEGQVAARFDRADRRQAVDVRSVQDPILGPDGDDAAQLYGLWAVNPDLGIPA